MNTDIDILSEIVLSGIEFEMKGLQIWENQCGPACDFLIKNQRRRYPMMRNNDIINSFKMCFGETVIGVICLI